MVIFYHLVHDMMRILSLLLRQGEQGLIAEVLLLQQQLHTIAKDGKRCPNLTPTERCIFAILTGFISETRLNAVAIIVKPATLIKYHSALVKNKFSVIFGNRKRDKQKPGPKGLSQEVINAIVQAKILNYRMGANKIKEMINLHFKLELTERQVRHVIKTYYKPDPLEQYKRSWLTFLGHTKDSLWSLDWFRVESATLQSYWVMVVMDQFTRKVLGFGVNRFDPDGPSIVKMFIQATKGFSRDDRRVSRDNHLLFKSNRWQSAMDIYDITEIPSVPFTPESHPFIERVIGTIRREYLNQVGLFYNEKDLINKLDLFKEYYNKHRTHEANFGITPALIAREAQHEYLDINHFTWQSHCHGLFYTPVKA